jgi:hypothetical protein
MIHMPPGISILYTHTGNKKIIKKITSKLVEK